QVDKRAKVRVSIRDALYELPWLDDASVVDATTRIFEHFLGASTPAAPHETPAPSARGPTFVLMDRVEVTAGRHVNHAGTVVAARGPAGGRSNERLVRIDVKPTQPELKVTIPDEHLQRLGPREDIAP